MKKLTTFFIAFVLIVLMGATLFVAGAIYDSSNKLTVEPYFFQPDNLSYRRIGVPASPADLGDTAMRERLIRRYVTEYFYVFPSDDNVARRAAPGSVLATLSADDVFEQWTMNVLPQIQKMANDGKLRLVKFSTDPRDNGIIKRPNSDYWEVQYELHTWDKPNNMATIPNVTRGVLLLRVEERDGIRKSVQDYGIHKYLDEGNEPVTLFRFGVTEVAGI